MDELSGLLREIMNEKLVQAILSNSRDKSYGDKLKMRPVLLQGKLMFQSTRYAGNQVFHENHDAPGACGLIEKLLQGQFRQCEIITQDKSATVLVSKKGKMTIKARSATYNAPRELSHNREKQYILREGCPVDFLVGLGVQTPDGWCNYKPLDKTDPDFQGYIGSAAQGGHDPCDRLRLWKVLFDFRHVLLPSCAAGEGYPHHRSGFEGGCNPALQ
jgi:hypothetical protein